MTLILAVGLAWLLAATVVAVLIGRGIRLADSGSPEAVALDRLIVGFRRDLDSALASDAALDRSPRTA